MVKYADSPTTASETTIDASIEDVWSLISDINLPGRFSDEFQRAEWVSDEPAVGASFRGTNRREGFGEWTVDCTLTAYDMPQTFEWTVGELSNKVSRWRFDASTDGEGTTLRFGAEMGPGPSGLTPAIERMPDREDDIVARRLSEWRTNMERTLAGIKALAEGTTPPPAPEAV